jgi:hypothetical protein
VNDLSQVWWMGLLYVVLMQVTAVFRAIVLQHYFYNVLRVGVHVCVLKPLSLSLCVCVCACVLIPLSLSLSVCVCVCVCVCVLLTVPMAYYNDHIATHHDCHGRVSKSIETQPKLAARGRRWFNCRSHVCVTWPRC